MNDLENLKKIIAKPFTSVLNGKVVTYNQLSYYDVLQFIISFYDKQDDDLLHSWIISFLKEQNPHLKDEDFFNTNLATLWNTLKDTAFKGYFDEESKEDIIKDKKNRSLPFNAFLISLTDILKLEPIEILKRYTPEALKYLLDGYIFYENEKTKEGRIKNDLIIMKENKEEIKKVANSEANKILELERKYEEKKKLKQQNLNTNNI